MLRFASVLTALVLTGVCFANPGSGSDVSRQQQVQGGPSENDANPLIVELKLKNHVLSPVFPAVMIGRKYLCLPFKELCEALQISVAVDLAGQRAVAMLPKPHGQYVIDGRQGKVQFGSATVEIVDPARVRSFDGDLYVDAQLITIWLPVRFKFDFSKLELEATPTAKLPIEAAWERDARRNALKNRPSLEAADPVPVERTKYSLLSVPFLDLTFSSDYQRSFATGEGARPFQRIQISGSGDLLFMGAKWFTSGDWQNPFRIARLTLSQSDPFGRLLGPMRARQFSLGDLWLTSSPLLSKSRLGLGFEVSSFPIQRSAAISKTTVAGDSLPGWEVELYRNDELVAYQVAAADGTYRFEDVGLLLGPNNFRIVSYGPKGEVREEARKVFVGAGLTKAGEQNYRVAVVQQSDDLFASQNSANSEDRGKTRWLAEYERGLSATTALTARMMGVPFQDEDRTYTSLGLRKSLGGAYGTLDLLHDSTGGWGVSAGLVTRIKEANLSIEIGRFGGGFVSEQVGRPTRPLEYLGKARLDGSLRYGGWLPLAFSFGLEYGQDTSGRANALLTGRFATNLAGTTVSNALQVGRRLDQEGRANGALSVRKRVGSLWYRGEVGYALDRPSAQSLSLAADWIGSRDLRGQFGYKQELQEDGRSALFAGLHQRTDTTSLGLTLEYDRKGHVSGGLTLSMGLGADPRTGSLLSSGESLTNSGLVSARVFYDKNGNGVFDGEDQPLQGVRFLSGRRRLDAVSGADGVALLRGLPNGQVVELAVDLLTVEDVSLAPSNTRSVVIAHEGKATVLEIPMVSVADIEGLVFALRDGRQAPVPGVEAVLLGVDGHEVARTVTAYDGFYLFESVRPGTYTVRLEPDQVERLGLSAPTPRKVTVKANGTADERPDFSLLQKLVAFGR